MTPSSLESITPYPVVQLCFTVDDLDRAVDRWVRVMGAGPFFVLRDIPLTEVTFRGRPSTYLHSAALGQWGEMQVELHQQLCDTPSPAKELFGPGEHGLLQVTWLVDDVPAEVERMEALGFPPIFTCNAGPGMDTVWFDARSELGTYVEVYQGNEIVRGAYAAIREASMGWNGERPLRTFDALGA